jgi:hypothetical protein
MKRPYFLIPLLALAGCQGDPEPTVGDAKVSKGIVSRKAPKPPAALEAQARARAHRAGQALRSR